MKTFSKKDWQGKTYKEALNMLPGKIAAKAINNTDQNTLKSETSSTSPLAGAFIWGGSPQGYAYWCYINAKYFEE